IHKERFAGFSRFADKFLGTAAVKAHGDPFIPSRYKYKLRIYFQRAFPLFGEVQPFPGALFVRLLSVMKAAADVKNGMFRHSHADLLRFIFRFMPAVSLRGMVHPGPFIFSVAEPLLVFAPGPGPADGEESAGFGCSGFIWTK